MTLTISEILEIKRIIATYAEILKTIGSKESAQLAAPGIKIAIRAIRKMEQAVSL